jgi:hypothetical protein
MGGSGVQKRQQATAIYAYKLSQDGRTNREIADITGKPVERVPTLIKRGERLNDAPPQFKHTIVK